MGEENKPWRILEFYSGIGAMRYSLMRAGIRGEVVESFDINDRANDVYQHNFGHRPRQGNIQSLTSTQLDKYEAHAWLLSPPCQPYTRQGLQKHSADARASSFIRILELIPSMLQPPLMLFVENVVGFEISDTHGQLMDVLAKTGFVMQEYILSPLQFGVPYSRPRYFCLAKRKPLSFQNPSFNSQLLWTPIPFQRKHDNDVSIDKQGCSNVAVEIPDSAGEPIKKFLQTCVSSDDCPEKESSNICKFNASTVLCDGVSYKSVKGCEPKETGDIIRIVEENVDQSGENGADSSSLDRYTVPLSLVER